MLNTSHSHFKHDQHLYLFQSKKAGTYLEKNIFDHNFYSVSCQLWLYFKRLKGLISCPKDEWFLLAFIAFSKNIKILSKSKICKQDQKQLVQYCIFEVDSFTLITNLKYSLIVTKNKTKNMFVFSFSYAYFDILLSKLWS